MGTNPLVQCPTSKVQGQNTEHRLWTLDMRRWTFQLTGRDSSRQNGDCPGSWSSKRRVGLTPRPDVRHASACRQPSMKSPSKVSDKLKACRTLGPRSRHRSSKPNLQEPGGTARGSTPPRASNHKFQVARFKSQVTDIELETLNLKLETIPGCVAQAAEQASHKREVGGSNPPTATKLFWAGDVTESIEVLQTSCEGLTPSQSTKFSWRCSSIGYQSVGLVNRTIRVRLPSSPPARNDEP